MVDVTKRTKKLHHLVKVPGAVKTDAHIWLRFLVDFNGVSFGRKQRFLGQDFQIQMDAAGSHGFRMYFQGHWYAQRWLHVWEQEGVLMDLTFLELFLVVEAVHLWGEQFKDSVVLFWC